MASSADTKQLLLQVDASVELLRRNMQQADQVVSSFAQKSEQSFARYDRAMARSSVSTGQMKQASQQLSYQIGDVASQFASGTPVVQIFAQQIGQTVQAVGLMTNSSKGLIGFLAGPWGAVLTGAVAIVASLATKLFDSEDAGKAAARGYDAAAEAANRLAQAQANARKGVPTTDIQELGNERGSARASAQLARQRLQGILRGPVVGDASTFSQVRPGEGRARKELADALRRQAQAERDYDAEIFNIRRRQVDAANREATAAVGRSYGGGGSGSGSRSTAAPRPVADSLLEARRGSLSELLRLDRGVNIDTGPQRFDDELSQRLRVIDQARDAEFEARMDVNNRIAQAQGDKIRSLANLYETAFTGAGSNFLETFKRIGIQVVSELAARLTLGKDGNFSSSLGASISSVFGGFRAGGGPVSPGKAYVVGERRAELFVPKVPGTILPSLNGGQQSVHVTVTASPEFRVGIQQGYAAAAQAGAMLGKSQTIHALNRPGLGGR